MLTVFVTSVTSVSFLVCEKHLRDYIITIQMKLLQIHWHIGSSRSPAA